MNCCPQANRKGSTVLVSEDGVGLKNREPILILIQS